MRATVDHVSRVAERSALSAAEYLAWEREQPVKHEYFQGEVFAMAGGSPRHNFLSSTTQNALHGALRDRGGFVLTSDQRLGIDDGARYVYPDVSVVCGKLELQTKTSDVLVNPTILVEVLSTGTEQYDRGLKWESYQRLPSLTDYLLVSQAVPRIEQFHRTETGIWTYRAHGKGEHIALTGSATIDLDAIFAGAFELPGD
jgi:Uma2 family endonuclease